MEVFGLALEWGNEKMENFGIQWGALIEVRDKSILSNDFIKFFTVGYSSLEIIDIRRQHTWVSI